MRVLHVITALETGGAETMLVKLLSATEHAAESAAVLSLRDEGALGARIHALGVPLRSVGIQGSVPSPAACIRLGRLVRESLPDLLQGWMYHGNLAASLAWWRDGRRVLWNVRQTVYDLTREKRSTAAVIRVCARLSSRPAAIVYNSRLSASQHEALGFDPARRIVIPNGFDLSRFAPSPSARATLRRRLDVPDEALIVGLVARMHPMKDHATFLRAAAIVGARQPDVHFVLVGRGAFADDPVIGPLLSAPELRGRVHTLGEVADTAEITSGFDVACNSSAWGEAFPNAVGEAMACGVPCVVTDVGESREIVGDTGAVVSPRAPDALAAALLGILQAPAEGRRALGARARQRVADLFALGVVARRYMDLYESLHAGRP
jgi:glycosyltransferase involved in cell wall biosynthesis